MIQEFEKETSLSVVEINREDSCLLIKDIEIKVALPRHMSKEYCEEQEKEWERMRDKGKKRLRLKPQSEWKDSMVPETKEEEGG